MTDTILIACPHCKVQLRGPTGLEGKKVRCKSCGHTFVVKAAAATPAKPPFAKPSPPKPNGSPVPGARSTDAKKAAPAPPAAKPPAPKGPAKAQTPPEGKNFGEVSAYGIVTDDQALKQMQEFHSKNPPGGGAAAEKKQNPYGMTEISLLPRCPHCANEMPSEEAIICLHCGYNTHTRTHVETKRVAETTPADVLHWRLPAYAGAVVALCGIAFLGFVWLGASHVVGDDDDHPLYFMTTLFFRIYGSLAVGVLVYFASSLAYYRLVLHPDPPEQKL